jgi:arylsulfatase A-like enzyme
VGFTAWAALVPPRFSLGRELFEAPGAVIAPLLAHLRLSAATDVYPPADKRPDVPASSPALVPPGSIVILFVVDALRADVVANEKLDAHLPNIAALRREAVDFTKARSPASGTIWTLASMFSSRYYSELYWTPRPGGVEALSYPYLDASVRFPEILKRAGIGSFSASQMPDVENAIGDCGVLRGFTSERLIPPTKPASGALVTDAVVDQLRRGRAGPLFLYVHYLETHAPYFAGNKGDAPFSRYLGEATLVDGYLARVRKEIADLGMEDRAVIIVAADHGEAFGEHQTWFHAVSVYEELLRVPLLIRVPGVPPRQVDAPVTLMDLGPTILDLFGQTTPGSYMGQSLVPFLRGESPTLARPIAAETGRLQRTLIFPDGFKIIEDLYRNTVEAYDLVKDPHEQNNVIDTADPRSEVRLRETRAFFERNAFHKVGYKAPYRP